MKTKSKSILIHSIPEKVFAYMDNITVTKGQPPKTKEWETVGEAKSKGEYSWSSQLVAKSFLGNGRLHSHNRITECLYLIHIFSQTFTWSIFTLLWVIALILHLLHK